MDRILAAQPCDETELMSISGVGPKLVEKHGAHILRMLGPAN